MIDIVFHTTTTPPVKAMDMFLGSELNVRTVKSTLSALWLDQYHRDAMLGLLDSTEWLAQKGMSEQGPKVTTSIHAISKSEAAEHSKDASVTTKAYQWLNKAHSSISQWLDKNNSPLANQKPSTLFWSDDPFDDDYDVFTPTKNTLLSSYSNIVDNKKFTKVSSPMRMTLTLHPKSGGQAFAEVFNSPRTAMSVIFNHEYMHAYQKYRCREDAMNPGQYAQSGWTFSTDNPKLNSNVQAQLWNTLLTYSDTPEHQFTETDRNTFKIFKATMAEHYADVGSMLLQYARTGEQPHIEGLATLREQGNAWHHTQDALRAMPPVLNLHDAPSIDNMEVVHQLTSDICKTSVLKTLHTLLNANPTIRTWFEKVCEQQGLTSQEFVQSYDKNLTLTSTIQSTEPEMSM